MNTKPDHIEGHLGEAEGTAKETTGALIGNETLEAEGAIQKNLAKVQAGDGDAKQDHLYKIVAIYPNFTDVGDAIFLLKNEGFTDDQISLLGREQEHWQEKLGNEWESHKTAKGALVGGAWGAVPGLVLVAGVAITGGAGLLVVGPMLGALSALGMGTLAGSLMGAGSGVVADTMLNVEEEVANAISLGHWVIIVHCHTDAEAAHAQGLLPDRRIVRNNDKAMTSSDLAAAEQADMHKLAAVVQEAFLPVTKASKLPLNEVMCNIETLDEPELKQAVQEAISQIANATGLATAQITDIFKANRGADVNIVSQLHKESRELHFH
jgi:uncharacterized protein YjbJ (UPF0337 family)